MSVLSIEGSGKFLSLAFDRDGDVKRQRICMHNDLCERLIDEIDDVTNHRKDDISEVLVGDGPGSFTSLRIVFSTAKGLALALGIPVRKLSVLSLIALSVLDSIGSANGSADNSVGDSKKAYDIVIPLTDARKGRLYYAAYSDCGKTLVRPGDKSPEEIASEVASLLRARANGSQTKAVFAIDDDSLTSCAKDMAGKCGAELILSEANLAETMLRHSDMCSILEHFQGPTYIRRSDAEENLLGLKRYTAK